MKNIIGEFWNEMDKQNWNELIKYFSEVAVINWHDTNESFTPDEFVKINEFYPGNWKIKIERIEEINNLVVSVVKVPLEKEKISFHAVSFFNFENRKIKKLDEYWGKDEEIPQWRKEMKIGRKIKDIVSD